MMVLLLDSDFELSLCLLLMINPLGIPHPNRTSQMMSRCKASMYSYY